MTRTTQARIAGVTFLFYIAAGVSDMLLMSRATSAEGTAARLARVAEHASDVRLAILLVLLQCFSALVLGVTLYGITRDEDHELAMLGLACRVGEGVLGAIGIPKTLAILWLATAGAGAFSKDTGTANTIGAFLFMPGPRVPIGAIFWTAGSAIFSYLLLRGRTIPVPIAWLGIVSSVLLLVGLPLQLVGIFTGPLTGYMWAPALVFELAIGPWLIIKGVAKPAIAAP